MAGKVKLSKEVIGATLVEAFKGLDVDFAARCIQRGCALVKREDGKFTGFVDTHGQVLALCEAGGVVITSDVSRDARNARYEAFCEAFNEGDKKAAAVKALDTARKVFGDENWAPSAETVTYTFPPEREF